MPELTLVLMVLVYVAMLFWVYRDATRRGMNAWLWVAVVFFLHLLGLVVYLIARRVRAD